MDAGQVVSEALGETLRYARAMGKIDAMISATGHLVAQLVELKELDDDLTPEIAAAATSFGEGADALMRAATFADSRLLARLEGLASSS